MPTITFSQSEVLLRHTNLPLVLTSGYRRKVNDHWDRVNAGGQFFNGPVLAASAITEDDTHPRIELALTDYAHYLYAAHDPTHEFDCRAVFSAAIILTSDNFLLLGEMASHTSAPGQIQCPGGGIELGDDRKLNAKACCQREVSEELGPAFSRDLRLFQPICFKTGGKHSTVGIFYAMALDIGAEQAAQLFSDYQRAQGVTGELPEFERLHAVRFEFQHIRDFIKLSHGHLVDYLAPLLIDNWQEASSAILALDRDHHPSSGTRTNSS
ncbi:NUDIX hydrolase [Neorhizobium galegae]|uniref:NUDIX hydrolase n=1 Tax=Neorhizobium galegae TaxID=399 RepID=UPI0021017A96|nr:NUDIX hydrolase [Neorhizobium galegae]MCQ1571627.1 NUDIX hydrolase [Neorhizobium galegae]